MVLDFAGQVAVVIGGTRGIGRTTALAFAEAGASVVIAGRDEEGGTAVAERARELGRDALFLACDVTDDARMTDVFDTIVARFGRLDCAFNCAGRNSNLGVAGATGEDLDAEFAVNGRGVFLCVANEIRVMKDRGGGSIVNASSAAAALPCAAQAVYGMSKAAVSYLTISAAAEVGKLGIRVNEITPALLMTEMVKGYYEGPEAASIDTAIERIALTHAGTPEDAAAAVLFLSSAQAGFITGASLPVDGGFRLYNAGSS